MKPTYVTFEQAKKLKEKGFNEKVKKYYQSNGNRFYTEVETNFNNNVLHLSIQIKIILIFI
jgi:hypothetical protein